MAKRLIEVHPTSGYSVRIERLNSLSHAFGVVMGVVALVVLVVWAGIIGSKMLLVSSVIYGVSLILLFTSSTCYHSVRQLNWKRVFLVCDHSCIYVLIAGTYTPFALGPLRGSVGWTLFAVVWALAAAGLVKEFKYPGRGGLVSTSIYLGMGWVCLFAIVPLWHGLSGFGFFCLVAGGVTYSLGTLFYLWKKLTYHHVIWHLFVLGGSFLHLLSVFSIMHRLTP